MRYTSEDLKKNPDLLLLETCGIYDRFSGVKGSNCTSELLIRKRLWEKENGLYHGAGVYAKHEKMLPDNCAGFRDHLYSHASIRGRKGEVLTSHPYQLDRGDCLDIADFLGKAMWTVTYEPVSFYLPGRAHMLIFSPLHMEKVFNNSSVFDHMENMLKEKE